VKIPRQPAQISRTGWTVPSAELMCGQAMTRVRGVIDASTRPTISAGSLAGTGSFTDFHTTPWRLLSSSQQDLAPTCSWSV
jgi:hypothetical protein